MKITAIRTHYVRIPFDMGAPKQEFAGLRFPTMDHLLVEVETDAGITGWGEGFGHSIIPATKTALEAYVGPWFLGKDPTDINALHREAAQSFHIFGRNGPVVYAHSAVDIALWDIAGKRAGLPLCDLLGGARRHAGARLRQPHALRHAEHCRAHVRRDGRARLQAHQVARDRRRRRSRPHAKAPVPASPS